MLHIPLATYRLQLHAGFTFDDASRIADYLYALGVSHVYCSPYMQAAPGSKHGYDVVDHQRVNDELGGEAGHEEFCKKLKKCNLGQVLDIVPNHMSLVRNNQYWWDVLENGASSRYASYFDIDWKPAEVKLRNKVLVPILGDQYGRVLSSGDIKLVRQRNKFVFQYGEHVLPVAPRSMAVLLTRAADKSNSDTLHFLADSLKRLPAPNSVERSVILARHRDKTVLSRLLERVWEEDPLIAHAIDESIAELNSDIDALDSVLNQQNYRLAYWRTADQELGYRRFFDVNTLGGLRVEREHVFAETHARTLEWLKSGVLDGVRVDHPDGLRDPLRYLERLRSAAPSAWIVCEKILEPGEELRDAWPVQGTTGYDFLNQVNGLLINPKGLGEIDRIYSEFTGKTTDYAELCREKKLNVMQEGLGSDVNRLTSLFVRICEGNRDRRDYTRTEVRRAIREIAACFPVYRTYADAESGAIADEDKLQIRTAVELAKQRRGDIDHGLFDFVGDVLCLDAQGKLEAEFTMRFQQFTSPVMAKGVEDTVLYCYNRLSALNEVGSDPSRPGVSLQQFHQFNQQTHQKHPFTMLALSTHDTKRSDDVRARLCVLTEMPARWRTALRRWSRINEPLRKADMPDRNTEYLYYQTLIGAWPLDVERAVAYMRKATREAKEQTSWTAPNHDFERSLESFIWRTLEHEPFLNELREFVSRLLDAGRTNSLTQTLLKYTSPGVPDLYQGSELWDLSLVDPDNRREVDYAVRRKLMAELPHLTVAEVMARADEGLPKIWTIYHSLRVRRSHIGCFGAEGVYTPIQAQGSTTEHLVSFRRGTDVIALAPRYSLLLGGSWAGSVITLPSGNWVNAFTGALLAGGRVKLQTIFEQFPVALLTRGA